MGWVVAKKWYRLGYAKDYDDLFYIPNYCKRVRFVIGGFLNDDDWKIELEDSDKKQVLDDNEIKDDHDDDDNADAINDA